MRNVGIGLARGKGMSKAVAWSVAILAWLLAGTAVHAGERHYYYTDPQGTVLAKADATGNIVEMSDYRPYGARALGAAANAPGYTGHVNDADSGLVYMQARYYDPLVGHFISADPVRPVPGNLFGFSRYLYTNDNPVRNTDPDGRQVAAPGDSLLEQEVRAQQIDSELYWDNSAENGARLLGFLLCSCDIDQHNAPGDDSIQSVATPLAFGAPRSAFGAIESISTKKIMANGADLFKVGEYSYTRTVANHLNDTTRLGQLTRPFLRSPSLIKEIVSSGSGVADPGGLKGALRFDLPGSFNGTKGTWQLVINQKTKVIYHFNFVKAK